MDRTIMGDCRTLGPATAPSQNNPPPPTKSKRLKEIEDAKKKEDDTLRNDVPLAYFDLPLPDDMEIEERTRTKKDITRTKGFYCRNKLCTKGCSGIGKEGEKEMCKGCATEVRQFRRKLEFDKEFKLADDFDNILADINGKR